MNEQLTLKEIAVVHSDFPTKFGIPRQSGLATSLISRVVFNKEYRTQDAFRGLETFSHVWLIWGFSKAVRSGWSATVRPPRLGGNTHVGVFASRSPYRPNPIGLSAVKLERIETDDSGGVTLVVSGADLMDGTPIYDVKPYLPLTDCRMDAVDGFAADVKDYQLDVRMPVEIAEKLPVDKLISLREVLSGDPRPAYQDDPDREYGFVFGGYEIKFKVADGVLTVTSVAERK